MARDLSFATVFRSAGRFGHELIERNRMVPTGFGARFGGITKQEVHFSRAKIPRINLDQNPTGSRVDAGLINTGVLPFNLDANLAKCFLDKFPYGGGAPVART